MVKLSNHAIRIGELERSNLLYTPARLKQNTAKHPLVLIFPGGVGTAKGNAMR